MKHLKSVLAAAAAIGLPYMFDGSDPLPSVTTKWAQRSDLSDFAKRSNEFKALCRPRLVHQGRQPIRKPRNDGSMR